jgi:hypothetical protein
VLNRYGIQTEFSGNLIVNLNVAIQDKDLIIATRRERKEKDLRETANLMSYLDSHVNAVPDGNNLNDYNLYEDVMRTQNFGYINRFST